jgi:CheY-like chemotaxis protein
MSLPYHIIIADDDDSITRLLVRVLTRIYPTAVLSTVGDGPDALAVYAQRGADLLITNNRMPTMSGLDLIRALRAGGATLPILMISGTADEPRAMAAGATQFLAKPFLVGQLEQVVTGVLRP